MKTLDEINRLIAAIEAELVELESSRTTLLSRVAELQREKAALLQVSTPLDFKISQLSQINHPRMRRLPSFAVCFAGARIFIPDALKA